MPHLGYKSPTRRKGQELPASIYFDLATWHRINKLYHRDTFAMLREIRFMAKEKNLVDRLISVIHRRTGHSLLMRAEEAKIELTESELTNINLDFIEEDLQIALTRQELNDVIQESIDKILMTVRHTITQANILPENIQTIFMTGGSTAIVLLQRRILQLFPDAHIVYGDPFSSVGLGLTLAAQRKFASYE